MSKRDDVRLDVRKMYKLYINGAFVRSESGRSDPVWNGKAFVANVSRASRKDVRDAVVAARAAQAKWWGLAPATRGLILYRLAEMLEARHAEFVDRLRETGANREAANAEVDAAIDRSIWYAGWCDKFLALLSGRNPVAGPHFNASTVEPMGIVAMLAPEAPSLLGLVSTLLPPIVGGNTVIALASQRDARTAVTFAETLATCDLPAGVANVLTGRHDELAPILAKHMDIDAMELSADEPSLVELVERESAENLKRVRVRPADRGRDWFASSAQSLDGIAKFCEVKTIWHPAGV